MVKIFLSVLFSLLLAVPVFASEEPYQVRLTGRVKAGDTLLLRDEKFQNSLYNWDLIQNHKVSNLVVFELNTDSLTGVKKPFTGKIDLKVEYWSQPGQADPFTEEHLSLEVKYDTVAGLSYKGQDIHRFLNGHKVKLTVNSIECAELGDDIPGVFMLTSMVVVDRSYQIDPAAPPMQMFASEVTPSEPAAASSGISTLSGDVGIMSATGPNSIILNWTAVPGKQYDLEWTFIDEESPEGLRLTANPSPHMDTVAKLFRNNATRVSLPGQGYTINLVHHAKFLLVRYRIFDYNATTGIRDEDVWKYNVQYTPAGGSPTLDTGVIVLSNTWHQPDKNWQYAATYAEEGKRKEVVSYFDKSLKNRQSVTLMKNSTSVSGTDGLEAVVQSTIYDQYGRPAVDVLPAPLFGETALNFYPRVNRKLDNTPYSWRDVAPEDRNCDYNIPAMSDSSGAGRYYSTSSYFKTIDNHSALPDAGNYPFSLRYYTNDNTGRIASQGGVGPMFQPRRDPTDDSSRATRYFYSKPTRKEIFRLFGNDAGDASHYFKNTVIDPNGQVSVSYVNMAGKTVATALSGPGPANLDALPNRPTPKLVTVGLFKDADFHWDPTKLTLSASQTYVAQETGAMKFGVEMEQLYSQITTGNKNFCTACGFEIVLTVSSDCADFKPDTVIMAGAAPDSACTGSLAAQKKDVTFNFTRKGNYYILMEARLKPDQINKRANEYLTIASGKLRKKFDFVVNELRSVDFSGCFDDCKTCKWALGAKPDFKNRIKEKLLSLGAIAFSDTTTVTAWSDSLYNSLSNACTLSQANCADDPCKQLREMILRDVSPYGQYALFNKNLDPLEQDINVLHNYWRTVFPMLPATDTTYIKNIVQLGDTSLSVNDSTFRLSMLVTAWRPEWAEKFIVYHPEACGLTYCEANTAYLKWDDRIKSTVRSVADIPAVFGQTVQWNKDNPIWLTAQDPFFYSTAPGYSLLTAFREDLNKYSLSVKGVVSDSVKNLNRFIDFLLYCAPKDGSQANTSAADNVWNYCSPDAACRIPDREWAMYVDAYMELKQKYYQLARNGNAAYCRDKCPVGTPLGIGNGCPPGGAFTFIPVSVSGTSQTVKVRYEGGMAVRAMTLAIYYPSEAAGLLQVSTVSFLVNDSVKTFTIHKDIDVSVIKVKSVTCSGGTTTMPCSGVSYTLDLGTSGRRTGYRMWDIVENGKTRTYMAIEGVPSTPPVNGSYCATPDTLTYYDCLYIKYADGSAGEYLENVWLAACPPVVCSSTGSMMADLTFGHNKFNRGNIDVTVYPFTTEVNSIAGPGCSGVIKRWYSCFTVNMRGTIINYRNATVFECTSSCQTIPFTHSIDDPVFYPVYYYAYNGGTLIYTVRNWSQPNDCEIPDATWQWETDYSNSCVRFASEDGFVTYGGVWVSVCYVNRMLPDVNPYVNGLMASSLVGCPEALQTKQPRLVNLDYTTPTEATINEIIKEGVGQMQQQLNRACADQADLWISRLEQCGTGMSDWATKKVTLRTKLIELCNKGVDIAHPNGASTHPDQVSGTPKDFKEVIKTVLAITNLSANCNPWLLDGPYPYATPAPTAPAVILNTNQEICKRITELQNNYAGLAAPKPSFHQYLINEYGTAMTLTEADLTALVNSCGNCRYLLPKTTELPVFMNGQDKGYITGTELQAGYAALAAENLTGLAITHPNYETIVTNYLNHRWGFTLGYWDYARMKRSLDSNSIPLTKKLVNVPSFTVAQVNPYDCLLAQVQHAAINGLRAYDLYIEEVKRVYRAEYIKDCAATKGKLSITHTENEYHYTLYYYDQAGNLVRTVPPEGVEPLSDQLAAQAEDAAEDNVVACTYNGPTAATDLNLTKTYLFNALNAGTKTVEMWLYSQQVPHGQLVVSTGIDGYLVSACIGVDNMELDIYKLKSGDVTNNSVEIERSRHFKVKLASEAIRPWLHLVLQGTNMGLDAGTLAIYANGVLCPAVTTGTMPGTCGWEIGYVNGVLNLPNNTANLKQIRGYNRLLTAREIGLQYGLSCMGVHSDLGVNPQEHWGRFNIPAAGSATTVGNTTTETRYNKVFPAHRLSTTYAYQSLNGVTRQETPDAGASNSWFDLLGRIVASRNAQQTKDARMSYTEYDNQGRVLEVGEKATATGWTSTFLSDSLVSAFISNNKATRKHFMLTRYDDALAGSLGQGAYVEDVQSNLAQEHLRKRVSATFMYETPVSSPVASIYSYDILGNVKSMLVKLPNFLFKRIDYNYDLASGKVLFVRYKHNTANKFLYGYKYDAENRLIEASTGIQTTTADDWGIAGATRNAFYKYYRHGPLSRMELGGNLQGVDYAYTLQGWLKAINGQKLGVDIGKDGQTGTNSTFAPDVFNYSLDYYDGDYTSVSKPAAGADPTFPLAWSYNVAPGTGRSLYNGNIARATYGRTNGSTITETVGYSYRYDQLNRLTQMLHHPNLAANNYASEGRFAETITYDANGNIKTYLRNGHDAGGLVMDQLSYFYPTIGGNLSQNRLRYITDAAPTNTNYTADLKSQPVNNYDYDDIGNLTKDSSAGIKSITWTVAGKIEEIRKVTDTIRYKYDPSGNRVYKEVSAGGVITRTWYVRDALGNVLALYSDNGTGVVTWEEQHLYGSSRLGYWRPLVAGTRTLSTAWNEAPGNTLYELSNHLGNTLVVFNGVKTNGKATVMKTMDYYPFGMLMPGKSWEISTLGKPYRYGFNGKENDNEVKGEGNQVDFGKRILDPRIGRFLSLDPLGFETPFNSPYAYAENDPVNYEDIEGMNNGPTQSQARTSPSRPLLSNWTVNGNGLNRNGRDFRRTPAVSPGSYYSSLYNGWVGTSNTGQPYIEGVVVKPRINYSSIWDPRERELAKRYEEAKVKYQQFKQSLSSERLTNDAGNFSEQELQDAKQRIFKGEATDQDLFHQAAIRYRNMIQGLSALNSKWPSVFVDDRGRLTNGKYTIDLPGMMPHMTGDLSSGKSQFLAGIDAGRLVLDAAMYADKHNLWNPANNSAKVPVTNGVIGVSAKTGDLTNYINVYRTKTNFVHGSPGNPPKEKKK